MAEAFLNVNNKPQQKKRKATDSTHPKSKKSLELVSGMLPPQQSWVEYEQRIDEGHVEVIKKTSYRREEVSSVSWEVWSNRRCYNKGMGW